MKLPPYKNIKNWNYLAIAFAIPCVGMLLVMLFSQYEPFGSYSMLYSDCYHQYFPFFKAFRQALLSGESLLWSWNVGMGMDYLGLISYYLASPLNLLSVLVPETFLLEFFSLLFSLKLGLAGLFFAIFLKKTFGKDDLSISLFGGFYGLCAWALGFQWNIMWVDTFALLPLVALGTIALLKEKKFFLYTVTLFLSVFSNYYIGFFTCIFVLLTFICYQICNFKSFGQFFSDLFRIAAFSILAIGMTAILELPAFAALQTTQSSVNQFPTTFRLNIADEHTWQGLLDAMRQVAGNMGGGTELNFKEGLPNIYCGVGTIILAVLFLTAEKVKLREKICCVFLLLFFILSFIIRQLDYIWHGFHFTNMIPYRFSFLYSFVMLYMAYRAYLMRKSFSTSTIAGAGLVTLGFLLCSNDLQELFTVISDGTMAANFQQLFQSWDWVKFLNQMAYFVFPAYNLLFLFLYLLVLIYSQIHKRAPRDADEQTRKEYLLARIHRREMAAMCLAGVMALELVLNLVNFGILFTGTGISNYPKGTTSSASMIKYMKERESDTLFYRAETTHTQTLNDGALNGYNGVSTFTSSANVRVTEFMQALGYGAKNTYNRYAFEESSPVANLFLNLKYMLERDANVEENNYFTEVHHYNNVYLLENNAYLPLGFLADSQLSNVDFSVANNRFSFQNQLMRAASGIEGNVWNSMSESALTITSSDAVQIKSQSGVGYASYETTNKTGTITYTYVADRSGFLCIDLNLSKKNSYNVIKNDVELYSESYSLPQMIAVSEVVPGDVIKIIFKCSKLNEKGTINVASYVLDEALFRQGYANLAESTLELTTFKTTLVEGIIDCNRDGLLYTSIPQDGNWVAYVDGERAETVRVGNAMVGVPMTEGIHEVTFRYENKAFSMGWKISLLCAVIFVGVTLAVYKPHPRKGKYERIK